MLSISLIMSFSIMSIMSKNLISMWYFMEISSLIFIYSLIKNNNPFKSPTIYLIMSITASLSIMISISIPVIFQKQMNFFSINQEGNQIFTSLAFFIKMGIMPFHSWMFKMTENMKWMSLLIFFSVMKIIPIWFSIMYMNMKMITSIIIINIMMSMWITPKSNNSFFFLAISSIINKMWILMSSLSSIIMSMYFSMFYFLVNSNFINWMEKNNSKMKMEDNSNLTSISILSLMGFPPFPMFFLKMMIMKNMLFLQSNLIYLAISIIIPNVFSSMMYLKFSMNSIINMKNMKNWKKQSFNKILMMITIQTYMLCYLIFMMMK